jgi:Domain of unknown function (DUF397)
LPALDVSGARWRKSSRSTDKANCVEVAVTVGAITVRDSKNQAGGVLAVSPPAWATFTTALRDEDSQMLCFLRVRSSSADELRNDSKHYQS